MPFLRYRIKSKLRFIIFMIMIFLIIISISSAINGYQAEGLHMQTLQEIRVIPGDTLWELAQTYGPNNRDIRKLIHQICVINDIRADELRPGQIIKIPLQ